jgi:hypothetical protein
LDGDLIIGQRYFHAKKCMVFPGSTGKTSYQCVKKFSNHLHRSILLGIRGLRRGLSNR